MKIIFFLPTLNGGGAERVVANLASDFSHEHDTSIVTFFPQPDEYKIDQKIKRYNLDSTTPHGNIKFFQYGHRIFHLRQLLKREKPDIVVSFMTMPNFCLLIAAIPLHIKTIFSVRNTPEFEYESHFGYTFLAKNLFKYASGGVFQTQDAQDWFPPSIQKKSVIIYNPVSDLFYKTEHSPRSKYIVSCGRLFAQKNQKMLIAAFTRVVKSHPDSRLYIYGDGELYSELQTQIQTLHMEKSVFLMGRTSTVELVLKEADIFVLSSDFEGMPNALMEAMAVGVPCISTDCPCGGPRALLEGGKNGVLVPVGDETAMAQAIIDLLNDETRKQAYGRNARIAAEKFTQRKIYQQWLAYINQILSKEP